MSVVSSSPITLRETFSFYVPASQRDTLVAVSFYADAVTVCGPLGPYLINSLRSEGWHAPVIFDRAGYSPQSKPIDAQQWFAEQSAAGADRLLSPGTWVAWDPGGASLAAAVEIETEACRGRPAALVLSHPGDPLGQRGAVDGLKTLTQMVNDLSILRTDHGGIGALVYGARLLPHVKSSGKPDSLPHLTPPDEDSG
jgi:hypothetical protein